MSSRKNRTLAEIGSGAAGDDIRQPPLPVFSVPPAKRVVNTRPKTEDKRDNKLVLPTSLRSQQTTAFGKAMSRHSNIAAGTVEIALLACAFAQILPGVDSARPPTYRFFPGILLGALCFIAAQAATVLRDRKMWWVALVKTIGYVVFGWLVFTRVMMGP